MSSIKLHAKLIKPHFALTLKQEQKNLIDFIMDEMKGLDVANLKLDVDFMKYLAEVIENQVTRKASDSSETKPSKMDILVEIVKRLFPQITDVEVSACKGIVEFLLSNKLIKKVPLTKIIKYYVKQRFFSTL